MKISLHISQELNLISLNGRVIFKATIKSENIVPEHNCWEQGRVLLKQHSEEIVVWKTHHTILKLEGTNNWQEFETTFQMNDGATKVTIWIGLSKATGSFFCRDISLYKIIPSKCYSVAKYFTISCWLDFLIYLFSPYFRPTEMKLQFNTF